MLMGLDVGLVKLCPNLANFVSNFNSPTCAWQITDSASNDGLLYSSNDQNGLFRFTLLVRAPAKRVWESLLSEVANQWEPLVKSAYATIANSGVVANSEIFTDTFTLRAKYFQTSFPRIGFKDTRSGVFLVVGESMGWAVQALTDRLALLSFIFSLPEDSSAAVVESVLAHPRRIKEFILSQ